MNIPYVFKKCTKCGEILPATKEYFNKRKDGKYGLRGECKKCRAEQQRQYQQANKEAIAEQKRQHYQDNKEAILEQKRQYYQANKEAKAEYNKQYYQANKEHIAEQKRQYNQDNKEARAEYNRQRYQANKEHEAERSRQYRQSPQGQVVRFNIHTKRRAKLESQGNGITKEQWLECMSFFNWQCAYSGITLSKETRSLDHIEPINKGGVNEIWNVVPMYLPYNSSKQDKDLLEWYTEQEFYSIDRLNKIYEWQEYAYNKWGTIGAEAQ